MKPRSQAGQASVELVAFLPLVLAVGLAVLCAIAAHAAGEEAGQAAEAGALALLQGRDPEAAARAALPEATRPRARISIIGSRVDVHVRPALPLPIAGLPDRLAADEHADAGPGAR